MVPPPCPQCDAEVPYGADRCDAGHLLVAAGGPVIEPEPWVAQLDGGESPEQSPASPPAPRPTAPPPGPVTGEEFRLPFPGEPTPRPAGDPTPRPAGDSTPRPAGDPTPRPAGDPTPRPAGDSTPRPAGDSTPRPAGDPTPRQETPDSYQIDVDGDDLASFEAAVAQLGLRSTAADPAAVAPQPEAWDDDDDVEPFDAAAFLAQAFAADASGAARRDHPAHGVTGDDPARPAAPTRDVAAHDPAPPAGDIDALWVPPAAAHPEPRPARRLRHAEDEPADLPAGTPGEFHDEPQASGIDPERFVARSSRRGGRGLRRG